MQEIYERLEQYLVDDLNCGLIVHYRYLAEHAILDFRDRIVYLEKALSVEEKIISLAHEIGHLIDIDRCYNGNVDKYLDTYIPSPLKGEMTAWKNSIDILKRFGFEGWELVLELAEKFIKTYINDEERIKDKKEVMSRVLRILDGKIN